MTTTRVKENQMCLTLTNSNVKKAVKSYTMSKRYINTMLRASVINILYHRLNIDEKEFITKNFNNIVYKTFRSKSKNVLIREFHTYMLACKDALDKNYLREFYLYFIDFASGDIIENYKFSFAYAEKAGGNQTQSEENLIESTCELLKTLEDLGKHEKFHSEIQLKVEFTYFDDTPEEYEPPGFRNIEESESLIRKITKTGNSVLIGTLFTGFHKLKCRGRGDVFNFNSSPSPTNAESEAVEVDQFVSHGKLIEKDEPSAVYKDIYTEDVSPQADISIKATIKNGQSKMNDTYLSQCIDISSEEEIQMNCPCKLPVLELCELDKIDCVICKQTYHAPCQGYLDNTFIPGPFQCLYCNNDSESIVAAFDVKLSKSVYRVRYILGALYKYGMIPDPFKTAFEDTIKNIQSMKIFEFQGNQVKVNLKVLNVLFKFDYKMPDMHKWKRISNI
ncbi:hypothetical protein MTP99_013719 [Tenebrio molitor]|uniref:uncharacterized protein n=1 Tax=Tenebrio molitor TaxID=7067 RepID=UPI0026FB0EBE|nr:hypothetical protein MTP99_013719 [Tenebrio molitor]